MSELGFRIIDRLILDIMSLATKLKQILMDNNN